MISAGAKTGSIDRRRFRVALAERELRQYEAAARAGVPPQSLSLMLNGRKPAPLEVVRRLEVALGLAPGALAPEGSP